MIQQVVFREMENLGEEQKLKSGIMPYRTVLVYVCKSLLFKAPNLFYTRSWEKWKMSSKYQHEII
jgi:hypothetical protein